MNALDLIGFVDATRRRLLAGVDLADSDSGDVAESRWEAQTLAAVREALKDAPEEAAVAWLIARMARLEARVEALSRALGQASAGGPPASASPDAGDAPAAPPADDSVVLLMDESLVQEGFYAAERGDTGVSYRWLGPDPVARVYLPRVGPSVEVTLVLAATYRGVDPQAIRVALNDGPWTPVASDPAGPAHILRFRPSPGAGGGGLSHRLDIDCAVTVSPADEGGSDRRRLGVAITRVEIAPAR